MSRSIGVARHSSVIEWDVVVYSVARELVEKFGVFGGGLSIMARLFCSCPDMEA